MTYEIGFAATWLTTSAALVIFTWLSYLVPRLRRHMLEVFKPARFNETSLFYDTLRFFEDGCPTSDILAFIIINAFLLLEGLVLTGVFAIIWPFTVLVLIGGVLPISISKMIPHKEGADQSSDQLLRRTSS
jgi:hypothetical protein